MRELRSRGVSVPLPLVLDRGVMVSKLSEESRRDDMSRLGWLEAERYDSRHFWFRLCDGDWASRRVAL